MPPDSCETSSDFTQLESTGESQVVYVQQVVLPPSINSIEEAVNNVRGRGSGRVGVRSRGRVKKTVADAPRRSSRRRSPSRKADYEAGTEEILADIKHQKQVRKDRRTEENKLLSSFKY
jgi:hypothetical protein